ncbi:MAG: RNA-binding S4 domain-containing protein [Pseudooceanicola sp.]|nr:RNA-binding S4 domain-containing protein [Pseudooceanicola sp.]
MADAPARLRVDKWLWFARFFKSRTLAAAQVSGGHLRIDGERVSKPSETVSPGDVLTFPQGSRVRVVRILALGDRRGPAPEAQALYEDLTPDSLPEAESGGPRPTKRDRRAIDALKGDPADD